MVLINEAPNQTAHVRLELGTAGKGTATQFQVVAGSSVITPSTIRNLSQALALPPYSVTLIRIVQS